ncbi:MAG: lipopolysaccharide biosynthesis protein [Bacteroidales bacterium]|nr:lipopolysaccharide biosynthesis protein [Bacteroidales bacterium]MDD4670973.1 lipopolysaccharide biosynthesis protein [Bacteroidales bacterium]
MASLRQQLVSGVLYTAISKYIGIVVSLVVAGVLARLLVPDDFGIVAIATVIISFFSVFSDLGISTAIIQKNELTERELSDIFSFTVWMGVIISGIFFAGSRWIAEYYDKEVLMSLCRILSVNLLFATINIVPNGLLSRAKRFKYLAVVRLSVQIVCGTAAVIAALSGLGLYSLLINPVFSSIFIFLASYRAYPQKFRLFFNWGALRKIFNYSLFQFLFSIVNYFSNNLDKLLIGKYMTMSDLGYYEKSYRLMTIPLQNITYVVTPVMHPVFSDFQNDKVQLATSYEKVVRFMSFIGFPLGIILFFAAREMMLIVYGMQWEPSVPVFRILSITVGIQIVLMTSGSIFQASNDTKSLFICGTFSAITNVSGVLAGIFFFHDLESIAWCLTVTYTINFIQCYWRMYAVTFKRSIVPFIKAMISPVMCSIILIAVMIPVYLLLKGENIFLTLAVKGVIFVAVCVGYVQLTKEYDPIGWCRKKIRAIRGTF